MTQAPGRDRAAPDEGGHATEAGSPAPPGDRWTPRVEGEEGDPTAFDFVFGGAVVVAVAVAILWAAGVIRF